MSEMQRLRDRVAVLERMDREAATHVESVIGMRTGFTGEPPYVGWEGPRLALCEALDERDALRASLAAREPPHSPESVGGHPDPQKPEMPENLGGVPGKKGKEP